MENARCSMVSTLMPCPFLIEAGETLSYECLYENESNLKSRSTLTCLSNGSLSGQPPVCPQHGQYEGLAPCRCIGEVCGVNC